MTLDDGDTQGFYIDSQGSAGPADGVESEGEQSNAEDEESMETEDNQESAERELDGQNSHEGSMPTNDSKDEEEDEEDEEEAEEVEEEEVLESPQPSTKKRKIGHTDFKEVTLGGAPS